jgi:general secretion pathway protein G
MKKAFTLIELLIVMAIIAILVGLAVPRFKGMINEGKIAQAEADLHSLRVAIESYYIHQNPYAYPDDGTDLCTTLLAAKPKLIESCLYDPFGATSTTKYQYAVSSNGSYYVIWSVGVDGAVDITGINNSGTIQGSDDDDIYATNGSGF